MREIFGLDITDKVKIRENTEDAISSQINLLKDMYVNEKNKSPENNFIFIKKSILAIINSSIHNLGMRRILTKKEILAKVFGNSE